jgi:hypothetical protein
MAESTSRDADFIDTWPRLCSAMSEKLFTITMPRLSRETTVRPGEYAAHADLRRGRPRVHPERIRPRHVTRIIRLVWEWVGAGVRKIGWRRPVVEARPVVLQTLGNWDGEEAD